MALGRLDSVTTLLPDNSLFLYMYIRKEAVLSSMIEGTQSSISDLLLYELDEEPGVPQDDVQEVSNYVSALYHGLSLLKSGLPISIRLIREVHSVLLSKGRGNTQMPGEFRSSQNWIGGTRPGNATFVPPLADAVLDCMSALEKFINNQPDTTPALLKAALAHVQFETIHPFLDGNGRLGRLLITLILCEANALREPMLYLSLYFKTHRQYYYELLNKVRQNGDWESWLSFFAEATLTTATQAVDTARALNQLASDDATKIRSLGRPSASALQIHKGFLQHPITSAKWLGKETGLSPATINKSLSYLQDLDIIRELTDAKRNRVYCYSDYIRVINEGTELL